jgi:anti-anti-sigma factor
LQSDQLHHGVVPAHLPPGRRRLATAEDVGLESASLEVRTRELSNGAYVVAPEGTLDVCTTARLEHALSRVVEARASLVIVDLSETSLADSAPLGLLVLVQRQLSRQGGGLVLACADCTAHDLLDATGLSAVFLIERSPPPPRRESGSRAGGRRSAAPGVAWRYVSTRRE